MGIKIKREPDIELTQDEWNSYMDAYQRAHMFYSGTPPTFESWVRQMKAMADAVKLSA